MQTQTALGLMSGTSLDGVDGALLQTDGARIVALGETMFLPYEETARETIRAGISEAARLDKRDLRPNTVAQAEEVVTYAHIKAVEQLLAKAGMGSGGVDVIGFHGHTLLHAPDRGLTIQVGDGQMLADATGIDTVYDFRLADMEAGGEGAPLAPIYHKALSAYFQLDLPVAFLNIGGVANLTFVGIDDHLVAFDTGPGNGLIDDWVASRSDHGMDVGGDIAARGRVDEAALAAYLSHGYFTRKAPKSLDRNDFSPLVLGDATLADGAATLTAFTVRAIERSLNDLPAPIKTLVVCGGGVHNKTIMDGLEKIAGPQVCVRRADDIGVSADFIEAQAFAYLAVRHREGLPASFATTTGARAPAIAGRFRKSRSR